VEYNHVPTAIKKLISKKMVGKIEEEALVNLHSNETKSSGKVHKKSFFFFVFFIIICSGIVSADWFNTYNRHFELEVIDTYLSDFEVILVDPNGEVVEVIGTGNSGETINLEFVATYQRDLFQEDPYLLRVSNGFGDFDIQNVYLSTHSPIIIHTVPFNFELNLNLGTYYDEPYEFSITLTDLEGDPIDGSCDLFIEDYKGSIIYSNSQSTGPDGIHIFSTETMFLDHGDGDYNYIITCDYNENSRSGEGNFTISPYETSLSYNFEPYQEKYYVGDELTLEAVYSSGSFVSGAECIIMITDNSSHSWFEEDEESYIYSFDLNEQGNYSYEIECDKLGYNSVSSFNWTTLWEETQLLNLSYSQSYAEDYTELNIIPTYTDLEGEGIAESNCIISFGEGNCTSYNNEGCNIDLYSFGLTSGNMECLVPGQYYDPFTSPLSSSGLYVESPTTDIDLGFEYEFNDDFTLTGDLTFTNKGQGWAYDITYEIYDLINQITPMTEVCGNAEYGGEEDCIDSPVIQILPGTEPAPADNFYTFWITYSWINNDGSQSEESSQFTYSPTPVLEIDYDPTELYFELNNEDVFEETLSIENKGNIPIDLTLSLGGELSEIIELSDNELEIGISESESLYLTITIPEVYEGRSYNGSLTLSYFYDDQNEIYEEIPIVIAVLPNKEWSVLDQELEEAIDMFENDLGDLILKNSGNIDVVLDIDLSGDMGLYANVQEVEGEYYISYGEEIQIQFSLLEPYQIMNGVWNLVITVSDEDGIDEIIEKNLTINPWQATFNSNIVDLDDSIFVAPDQELNIGQIIIENTAEQTLNFNLEDEKFVDSELEIGANDLGEIDLIWGGDIEGTYQGEFSLEDGYSNSIQFDYNITVVDFDIESVTLDSNYDLIAEEDITLSIFTTLEDMEHFNFELAEVNLLNGEENIGSCEKTSEISCNLPEIDPLLEQKDLTLEVFVRDLDFNILDSYDYTYITYADTYSPEIYTNVPSDVDPNSADELIFGVSIQDNVIANLYENTEFRLLKNDSEITDAAFDCTSGLFNYTTELYCSLNIEYLYEEGSIQSGQIYSLEVSTFDNYGNSASTSNDFLVIDYLYDVELEFTDAEGNPLTGISLMFCLPDSDTCSDPLTTGEGENNLTIPEIGNSMWDVSVGYQGIVDFTFYNVDLTQLEEYDNFFSLDLFDYSETNEFIPDYSLVDNYISLYGIVVESDIFDQGSINELHLDGTFFEGEDTPEWFGSYAGWISDNMEYVVCHDWNYEERFCENLETIEIFGEEDYVYDSENGVFSYHPDLYEEDIPGEPFSGYILSLNTCGNGYAETWENSESCPDDFDEPYENQETTTPSGGGGGSSGSSQPSQQLSESLIFSLNKIEKELFPGEQSYELIHISSITDDVTSLNVELSGDIINLVNIPLSIDIATNPDMVVNIDIPEDTENGLYEGKIIFTRAEVYSELLVEIRVLNPEYNMLSLDIDPIQEVVSAGEDISIETQITNNGNNQNIDLTLQLLDLENTENPISEEDYNLEVLMDHTELLSLSTPHYVDEGFYFIKGNAIYSGVTGRGTISMAQIEIIKSTLNSTFLGIKFKHYLLLISFILFCIGGFYTLEFVRQKTRRYKGKVDIKTIPRSGDRAAFIGKVAETPIKSYIGLDKLQTHTLVAGATGSGKTVGAMGIVEEALDKNVSVIVFDPTGQWTGYLRSSKQSDMIDRYRFFGMSPNSAKSYEGNVYKIKNPKAQINIKEHIKPGKITVFVVKDLKPKEIDVLVTTTIEQVFRSNLPETGKLKLLMVYDEVHRLLSKFGGSGAGLIQLERGAREFRKWGVGLVLISQVLSDFIGDIKANIGNEIQFRTRYGNDLERISTKYGGKYSKSVIRESVGIGMYVNAGYNKGMPYFVSFRPLKHNTFGLATDEINKYAKYNDLLDDIRWKILQLKQAKVDVFDIEIELKLIDEKLSQGNFNMVDLYLESLKPNFEKVLKKHRKKIKKKKIETFTPKELKEIIIRAKSMRKKYVKTPSPRVKLEESKSRKIEGNKNTKKLKKKKINKRKDGKKDKKGNTKKKRISRKNKKSR